MKYGPSYQPRQPIINLATLRAEKRQLRQHIAAGDEQLRQSIRQWPIAAAWQGLQRVGGLLGSAGFGRIFQTVLAGQSSTSSSFWMKLLKATAVFAGVKIGEHLMKKMNEGNTDDDAQE
ncbi:MAG: hypothetical protein MUF62_00880 [Chitinophagaceae bacterium]|nr:hypothetical protein [Chitinophagaceae bacterium]